MPVFEYEVVDRSGVVAQGRQQADDQTQLMQRLRERGHLVVSLRATTDDPRSTPLRLVLKGVTQRFKRRVKLNTLVLFTGQLAAMLEAGLHLVRILTAIAKESSDKRFAKIIEDVRDSLSAGASFAESLRLYPR
jgi:type II secretory pathway component PulF